MSTIVIWDTWEIIWQSLCRKKILLKLYLINQIKSWVPSANGYIYKKLTPIPRLRKWYRREERRLCLLVASEATLIKSHCWRPWEFYQVTNSVQMSIHQRNDSLIEENPIQEGPTETQTLKTGVPVYNFTFAKSTTIVSTNTCTIVCTLI